MTTTTLDLFTRSYVEAALWSSHEYGEDGSSGEALDANYTADDLAPACLASMVEDCEAFQRDHAEDIGSDWERAGHDFWLTRNRHGTGFWDRELYYGTEAAKRLNEAAHVWGSVDLYVGDDELIHCQ